MQRERAIRRGRGGSRVWLWVLGGVWGSLVLSVLGCVVGGVVWIAWLMRNPYPVEREVLLAAPCEGGAELSFVLEVTEHRLAGATMRTDFVGEWRSGASTATRTFPVDGEPPPLGAWPRHTLYGDGPAYVSFYLAPPALSEDDAARIERCTEANAPALLGAIDAMNARTSWSRRVHLSGEALAMGRGRIYWRVDPSAFTPEFRDGQRTLTLERDGALWLTEPWSGGGTTRSLVGEVVLQPDRSVTIHCREPGFNAQTDLPRFRDAEGRTVADVVGAPPIAF